MLFLTFFIVQGKKDDDAKKFVGVNRQHTYGAINAL